MRHKIPLFKAYSDEEDIKAVADIIKRGTYWASGPEVEEFEKKVCDYTGRKYAVAFNSGTSALHTLLLAHNIKDREVIVPSFTFIATANAVVLAGGKPVFAEVENETYGLDAQDVKKRITDKTKAILVVHYAGFSARDTEELRKIAKDNNLLFIEDAAESFGAKIKGKQAGTFGDSAIFSLCQSKIFTTGEGGLIVTDSREIYEKSKLIRSHGRLEHEEDYFSCAADNDYIEAGYNFRLPTILASLGISQLKKVDKLIEMRREKANYIRNELAKINGIGFMKEIDDHFQVYQIFTIVLENKSVRDDLQEHLSAHGILSKIYFNPLHLKTFYVKNYGYKKGNLPLTEDFSDKLLSIPFYPHMTKDEMDFLISTIKEFFTSKGDK
ncbi:DegT/DnrJ/EryC1/StrS family aminotransferase [Bacteroidota bacterium]